MGIHLYRSPEKPTVKWCLSIRICKRFHRSKTWPSQLKYLPWKVLMLSFLIYMISISDLGNVTNIKCFLTFLKILFPFQSKRYLKKNRKTRMMCYIFECVNGSFHWYQITKIEKNDHPKSAAIASAAGQ